jgi:hypothetical protein
MRNRSGAPNNDEDAVKLTLEELEQWITRLKWRAERADISSSLRRSAFKRLVWLEAQHERLHALRHPTTISREA